MAMVHLHISQQINLKRDLEVRHCARRPLSKTPARPRRGQGVFNEGCSPAWAGRSWLLLSPYLCSILKSHVQTSRLHEERKCSIIDCSARKDVQSSAIFRTAYRYIYLYLSMYILYIYIYIYILTFPAMDVPLG